MPFSLARLSLTVVLTDKGMEVTKSWGTRRLHPLQSVYWESEIDTWMLKLHDIQSLQNYG